MFNDLSQLESQAPLLFALINIAQTAGRAALSLYGGTIEVHQKNDKSPVTQADFLAHHCICESLKKISTWPILSEEGAQPHYPERAQWDCFWLVDPLDGTREFIAKTGEFTVNIALIVAGVAVLGVVYAPASDELYWGCVGSGNKVLSTQLCDQSAHAFKVSNGQMTPIKANQVLDEKGIGVVVSRFHDQVNDPLLDNQKIAFRTAIGSSLKICRIAEGAADLYIRRGPTCQWDTSAAQVVLEAAGGWLLRLVDARPLEYFQRESIINPEFIALAPCLALAIADAGPQLLQALPHSNVN